MKISVFWVVALCSLVDVNQCFRGHAASIIRVCILILNKLTLNKENGLLKYFIFLKAEKIVLLQTLMTEAA
jgi:hypothetical protein